MSASFITQQLATELAVRTVQIEAVLKLLDEGATVPFIARYRKEATGNLEDTQLRQLEERLHYLRELEKRRETILKTIEKQGKLTQELKQTILSTHNKTALEDLYLPYKPKRRTKAQIAREQGLESLAFSLLKNPMQNPQEAAKKFIDPANSVPDIETALNGAEQLLIEHFSEAPELIGQLRQFLWTVGCITATVVKNKKEEAVKFKDYFDYSEAIKAIPSHRALALFRGKNEGFLKIGLKPGKTPEQINELSDKCKSRIDKHFGLRDDGRPADDWLLDCVDKAWNSKLLPHLETELMNQLKEAADEEAIRVFAQNMKDLLLAAPAGPKVIMGLDPGLRTGVKLVVLDATGKVLHTSVIYPHPPKNEQSKSVERLKQLCQQYAIDLIAIGNGTGSRETDRLVQRLFKENPNLKTTKITVSEAGASVYSASELASKELPDLDVSLRGAVSIARRLQDPLAELVKIEPKAIGVGQYQHDVDQTKLERMLSAVVQDCVNAVGVDVNLASPALLSYISGLSTTLANNVVEVRNKNGAFTDRNELKKVPRLGPKAFEQAAGFLRIMSGKNPLDASSVHPEAYPVVQRLLKQSGKSLQSIIGDSAFLKQIDPHTLTDEQFGLPTVKDILAELEKPGRDPRPDFKTASFQEGVETINDLKVGMKLEGVVTNVTNFGAFVDIGVHQDGLVHISMLANRYVNDPRTIVKTGEFVSVTVVEVDIPRKRIALSMKDSD